jgi:murein tripeptide amidase MpaA
MITTLMLSATLLAQVKPSATQEILPPAMAWSGKSRELIAPASDRWITPAEESSFERTPSYEQTVAWLRRLDAASAELQMVSLGRSAQGRDVWMVIASRDRAFTPEAMHRTGKPVVLAQAGIHSGEIDGKDAGLMLLRDFVSGRERDLLEGVHLLFIPILSVDAHESGSRFARINQRGPEIMGWRTNSRNLNLNRDYTKLETEEIRAVVAAINRWKPDLYVDLHVTDGSDYQYDVTWGWNTTTGWSPSIVQWLEGTLSPAISRDLRAMGHIPGPLVFPINDADDPAVGLSAGNATPRLSTGYGDARQLPTVLVENHSLKPYEQRVLGMRVALETMLRTVAASAASLRAAIADDRRRRIDPIGLEWEDAAKGQPVRTIEFQGIESRLVLSPISGDLRREWLGRPVTFPVGIYEERTVISSASRPKAYWIPPAWSDVAGKLREHGIQMERMAAPRRVRVELYRLVDPQLDTATFEGHVLVKSLSVKSETHDLMFVAGSWRVPTDQPLGTLAAILLEPMSPDSFLRWGFFHSILQRTEYAEAYVLEPLAERMLENNPALSEEFRRKLATDAAFRSSPIERLRWFYRQTPYWDQHWLLYPVGREH